MVDSTSTNFPIDKARFVSPDDGQLTKEARTLLRTLWNRTGGGTGGDIAAVRAIAEAAALTAAAAQLTADAAQTSANASLKIASNLSDVADVPTSRSNLGLGSVALGNTVAGWTDPTGTGSRAAINADFTETAGGLYSQTVLQNTIDQLIAVQKALAQLILDAESAKVISK